MRIAVWPSVYEGESKNFIGTKRRWQNKIIGRGGGGQKTSRYDSLGFFECHSTRKLLEFHLKTMDYHPKGLPRSMLWSSTSHNVLVKNIERGAYTDLYFWEMKLMKKESALYKFKGLF